MRYPWALAAAVLFPAALATSVQQLDLKAQVQRSVLAIVATVTARSYQQISGYPWTDYTLAIQDTLWGSASVLPTVQGNPALQILGGPTLVLVGAPKLKVNGQYVLLLYSGTMDDPVVGVNQGIYPVQGGEVQLPSGPVALQQFENQLQTERSQQSGGGS